MGTWNLNGNRILISGLSMMGMFLEKMLYGSGKFYLTLLLVGQGLKMIFGDFIKGIYKMSN